MTDFNASILNPTNFRFFIKDAPYLNFFVQDVDLPTISSNPASSTNPFSTIHTPGDHLNFDPLPVTFLVDEDLNGYSEIYNWMRGVSFPTTFEEYRNRVEKLKYNYDKWEGTTSDLNVITMTGSRNMNTSFNFINAFPTSLTAPRLTTTTSGVQVVTCQATFAYTYFNFDTIKNS